MATSDLLQILENSVLVQSFQCKGQIGSEMTLLCDDNVLKEENKYLLM